MLRLTSLLLLISATSIIPQNLLAAPIEGTWARAQKDGGTLMRVSGCGNSYCFWVASGEHKGQLTGKLKMADDLNYYGSLTDLRNQKTYTGKAKLLKSGSSMKVSGCVLKFICVGETWSRR